VKTEAIILKAKALLAARDGDTAARATADAYLKQHHLIEEDIPPWRGLFDIPELEAFEQAEKAGTVTREQKALYDQYQALITLCGEDGLPKRRHFKRWPWLLTFAPPHEKAYKQKAILSLLGEYADLDDAAMHTFADMLEELKPNVRAAKKLLAEWERARVAMRELYGAQHYFPVLCKVLVGDLQIKFTKRSESEYLQYHKRAEEEFQRRLAKVAPIVETIDGVAAAFHMLDTYKISLVQNDGTVVATSET
jgi:hypothetical protein